MADLLDVLCPIIGPPSWALPAKTYRAAAAILLLCITLSVCGGKPTTHSAVV